MFYQCDRCEMIYKRREWAAHCCSPEPKEIPDEAVIYCLKCEGEGCVACGDRGILLKREAEQAALLRKRYTATQSPTCTEMFPKDGE